jgi:hypothetical protein
VYEATRWTVPIDRVKVSGPILVASSELDHLTPPAIGRSLATFYGADYRYLRGRGHNVLLEPNWRETASMIAVWLGHERCCASSAPSETSSMTDYAMSSLRLQRHWTEQRQRMIGFRSGH